LNQQSNIAILILAAGSSTRMGEPKQLLPWKNTFLLSHTINNALQLGSSKTVVVLGANYKRIKAEIQQETIQIVFNADWKNGLGSSIAFGVNHILNNYNVDGVFILLADQPLINVSFLNMFFDSFKSGNKQIIASNYENKKLGVPALFDKCYFEELSKLNTDKGAKKVIENHLENVLALNAKHFISDIDTMEDYKRLYDENH
jgi:molybdenum cofactor cytidylyltransferase